MSELENCSVTDKIKSILEAVENYRRRDHKASGVIFTDNWYDSHPRILIFDPVLNPYDKLVWLAIRSFCTPDLSLTAFPSYDQIQNALNISRGTVSCSITKLRVTRWITLLCRNRVRDASGRFTRDGNVYMVHGEPLNLKSTIELDANYMNYLNDCTEHRNSGVRKISTLIINSINRDIDRGIDVLTDKHAFQRRADAWSSVKGSRDVNFFEHYVQPASVAEDRPNLKSIPKDGESRSTVVHGEDYGERSATPVVHDLNYGAKHYSVSSSSGNKKIKYNNNQSSEEFGEFAKAHTFPKSLTSNQKHLIMLHLLRLPSNLPNPPQPWSNWSQILLDELEGRISIGEKGRSVPVWNPVSLMATYCRRLSSNGIGLKEDGKFQIEFAEHVIRRRSKMANSENAYKIAKKEYRRSSLKRLKEYQRLTKKKTN